ncbi:MAG: efflux RND transporter periplasmic adaptor subunit [Pseudomonadales bacterium]|nr:efflux RND transporter periplasmic adaptor subunit [Pseudomonadales bacterium]
MNASTTNKIWLAVVVVVLIFGIYQWAGNGVSESQKMQAGLNAGPLKVSVMKLESKTIHVYENLPGRTVAFQVAEIRPQVTGILKDRLFVEGSFVEEGTALYQIDSAPYRASYNSAVAALEKTKANLKSSKATNQRFRKLVKIDAVSQQEYDDNNSRVALAKADLGVAEAAVAQAKINLDFTNVYAPISGIIGKSRVTKGALITANQEALLATITQLDPIYVDMTLASSQLSYLRQNFGDLRKIPVFIFTDGEGKEPTHSGVLKFYEVTVDPTTSSVQLRAQFPNKKVALLPGLYVRAALQLELNNALLLPQKVTQRMANGDLTVWVVGEGNKVSSIPFREERAHGDQWVAGSGLNPGDVIVTDGMIRLEPGMTVIPINQTN